MQWRGRASKKVVEAVVAAFCDSAEESQMDEASRKAHHRTV